MDLLTEDEITAQLASLPGWARTGDSIAATFSRADFRDSLLFAGMVGYLAEAAGHHPDVAISWNKVTLDRKSVV